MSTNALHSPAADRNKQPILEALSELLPARGLALEIAGGSGQHAAHFATALTGWSWQSSDPDAAAVASIAALNPQGPAPLRLDVLDEPWPLPPRLQALDAIYCANMLHIAPWACCSSLMRGAARYLKPAGLLLVYGPFVVPGLPTAPSNLAFDADLRRRNPAWGLRSLDAVADAAAAAGLRLREPLVLPANNLLLVLEHRLHQPDHPIRP